MRLLIVPDLHEPATHPGALDFIDAVAQNTQPDTFAFIGDVADHHAISTWTKHPLAPGPKDEYEMALTGIQRWYNRFPDAIVCKGNHDERPMRLAEAAGVPGTYLKDHAQVWETPRWNWVDDITLFPDDEHNRLYLTHGTARSGLHPAFNLAKEMSCSSVMGHVHHCGGIKWFANPAKRWFGMDVGALIDDRLYAFAYGKPCKKKSVHGCGFVDTVNPMETGFIPMPSGKGERFSRERYPIHPLLAGRLA